MMNLPSNLPERASSRLQDIGSGNADLAAFMAYPPFQGTKGRKDAGIFAPDFPPPSPYPPLFRS
jgi:hypothetical protein